MKPSRRYFCYLLSAIATVKASAQSWLLPSKAFPYETIPVHQEPHSRLRHFFDGETHTGFAVELHESELAAGDAPHPPHHHVHEEVILIREGTVDVMISGQTTRLGPGSVAYIASNEEHGWRNMGTTAARYYLFALGPAWDYRERMVEMK